MRTTNSFVSRFLGWIFVAALGWSLFEFVYVLVHPSAELLPCGHFSKAGLLILQMQFALLCCAGIAVLFFPPTGHWKYWSLSCCISGLGVLVYWWILYLRCDLSVVYLYEDPLAFYAFVIWGYALWGMFIAYLTTPTRRKYAYAYLVGMALIIYIASQFDGTTNI